MPNRILKESICTSDSIDNLSLFHEVFFYRLIVNCDDYGRMDGRPKILASKLFPLKDVGNEDVTTAILALRDAGLITTYIVDGKPYIQMCTWDKHQQVRAHKSKYPAPTDGNGNQMISDEIRCPRNPIQSNTIRIQSESLSESYMDDVDAKAIQHDHDRVMTAAEDAGFKMTNDVRASLIALYADSGLEKMLEGIKSCSEHGAANLAYLRAVLRGSPKKAKAKVNAQGYEQRDYQDVQDEIEKAQNERILSRLKEMEE